MTHFTCYVCKAKKFNHNTFMTGYGIDRNGHKVCFDCCAEQDKSEMKKSGKIALYLDHIKQVVSNWPGTLKISCTMTTGKHNLAGIRRDVWFHFNGHIWHGTQYGNLSEIVHCTQTKQTI